jgi:hypothetical protein
MYAPTAAETEEISDIVFFYRLYKYHFRSQCRRFKTFKNGCFTKYNLGRLDGSDLINYFNFLVVHFVPRGIFNITLFKSCAFIFRSKRKVLNSFISKTMILSLKF